MRPHPTILGSYLAHWADETACAEDARRLALAPELRDACIALQGPLGAGKTSFVRHLLRALGVNGRIKSPSYTVLEPYALADLSIAHFDFYRFQDPREWLEAGFREIFAAPGLKLVEWPDKVGALMPPVDLWLQLEPQDDDSRQVRAEATTPRGVALLEAWAR